jgi:hypothetical protein
MKPKSLIVVLIPVLIILFVSCTKEKQEALHINYIDTLEVAHSMKGWELYSWPQGDYWHYSLLVGTNHTKTLDEVISGGSSEAHLITVSGTDTLKAVLARFPEDEYITWIGAGWLQSCWGGNYGDLKLPPQPIIDEIAQFCLHEKLNLRVTD